MPLSVPRSIKSHCSFRRITGYLIAGFLYSLSLQDAAAQSKIAPDVTATLAEFGRARIIVVMNAPKVGQVASLSFTQPAAHLKATLGDDINYFQQISNLPVAVAEIGRASIDSLSRDPNVSYVFADVPMAPMLQVSLATFGVSTLHQSGRKGAGQSVAVLDSGVESSHPMLAGKLVAEGCFSTTNSSIYRVESLCPNGIDTDIRAGSGQNCDLSISGCDHGTHVAGIAVGRETTLTDGSKISGVASGAGLIAIQVFTKFNDLSVCGGSARSPCIRSFTSDQLRALEYLLTLTGSQKVAAVNMSLGGGRHEVACDDTNPLTPVIERLRDLNIPTVIASGNDRYFNAVSAPGCISPAFTVTATMRDSNDLDISYANVSSLVDFAAPGTSIVASARGAFLAKSGTSMATPHLAGLIAIMKSEVGTLTTDMIEAALRQSAAQSVDLRSDAVIAFPDTLGLIDRLKEFASAADTRSPGLSLGNFNPGSRIILQLDPSGPAGAASPATAIPQIKSTFGDGTNVMPIGKNTYSIEMPGNISDNSLKTAVEKFGPNTKFFEDSLSRPLNKL